MKSITLKETYSDGQVIFKEGSHGEASYIVLSGKVAISIKVESAKIVVAHLTEGDILGQVSFIDKQPRSATATAIGDVELGVIDKDTMDLEINKTSEDFRIILKGLTERLRKTTGQLINTTIKYYNLKNKISKLNSD